MSMKQENTEVKSVSPITHPWTKLILTCKPGPFGACQVDCHKQGNQKCK